MLCGLKCLDDFYDMIDSNGRRYRLDNPVALLGIGTKDKENMQHLYNQGQLNQGKLIESKQVTVPSYQRYFGKI